MLTRRCFALLAATLPLNLLCRRPTLAQTPQPPPQVPTREEMEKRMAEWQMAHHLPIARVRSEGDRTLYSSMVNSIQCWADVGSSTWLGTRLGIKRVSKDPSVLPRHYTRADGLPGERIISIVADERGAFALIDLEDSEALCTFEAARDSWKTLARWPKGRTQEFSAPSSGYLALGQDVVLAAASTVFTKAASPLLCFGREKGEPRVLPWDPGVRADHTQISIRFISCREKTILLGTNIGLIELPLSADGGSWTRRLVDRSIRHGVEGSGKIYLWIDPRQSGEPDYYRPFPLILGQPHLYDAASGAVQMLPEKPAMPVSGAVVSKDGALWLIDKNLHPRMGLSVNNGRNAMFARWRSGDPGWVNLTYSGEEVPANAAPQPDIWFPSFSQLELPPIPRENTIPDAPARLAAAHASLETDRYNIETVMPFPGGRPPAVRWLKERFPQWLSPEDPEALAGTALFQAYAYPLAFPDPKTPVRKWQGAGPGAITATEIKNTPAPLFASETRLANPIEGVYMVPQTGTDLERIPLPQKTLSLHARLNALVPLNDGTYLALGSHAFHVTKGGQRWRELAAPPRQQQFAPNPLTSTDQFFPLGKGGALGTSWLENTMLQLDPGAGKLVKTSINRPNGGTFIGADAQGAWWHMGGNRLLFLAPGATAWQERTLTPPRDFSLYDQPRLCANRLWWRGNKAGAGEQFIGWNPKTDTWTTPLIISQYSGGQIQPVADSGGSVLVALRSGGQSKELTLHRWLPKKNAWEPFTMIPWGQEEPPGLLAKGSDGIWFLSANKKSLVRYEPRTKALHQEPLPDSSGSDVKLQVENDAIFLVGSQALWRFDRRKRAWTEWLVPVTTAQLSPQFAATDGTALWGFLNARNAGPPPLVRFEPDTRRFSIFDETTGLPPVGSGSLTEVGRQIWLLHSQGAFRFDSGSQRFVREVPLHAQRITIAKDNSTTWVGGIPKDTNGHTLYRWNQATKKGEPEEQSRQNRNLALLSSGNGVLAATTGGLFRIDSGGTWTGIDTWLLSPNRLLRDSKGAVWMSTPESGYLRIDTSAGL